jgi:hypothetical protein
VGDPKRKLSFFVGILQNGIIGFTIKKKPQFRVYLADTVHAIRIGSFDKSREPFRRRMEIRYRDVQTLDREGTKTILEISECLTAGETIFNRFRLLWIQTVGDKAVHPIDISPFIPGKQISRQGRYERKHTALRILSAAYAEICQIIGDPSNVIHDFFGMGKNVCIETLQKKTAFAAFHVIAVMDVSVAVCGTGDQLSGEEELFESRWTEHGCPFKKAMEYIHGLRLSDGISSTEPA